MVWRFLKKLNRELPQGRAIPLVGVYPKPLRTGTQTNPCARTHSSQLTITTQMPVNRRTEESCCLLTME